MFVRSGIFLCLILAFWGVHSWVQDPLDSLSAESALGKNPGDESNFEWIVYEHEDFEKNELCMVLSCKKHELCLVRNNNAVCAKRQKLDEIEGRKKFYAPVHGQAHKKSGHHEKKHKSSHAHDEQEWDHQKLRDKMINYQTKLKNKHKNKVKENMVNEVRYETDVQHPSNMPISSHERHSSKMGKYENCTEKEMLAIKGRLYKWFSDIHNAQKQETGYRLPRHEVKCEEDVGFMFSTLDGDTDGKLSVDELFSIDNDPYEKCIKPFLDRCDVNGDDVISVNEWCDCFQWSNDDRHEPACHAALRKHDPHDADSVFPNCDLEGYYKLDQCHKGFCWCVDKWGREFDRSKTRGQAKCDDFAV